MARVTIEDCIKKIPNPFELVLFASQRAKELKQREETDLDKENDNNTVDIIYNIKLGEKALIKNIKFVGNKVFKDNKLRKVIVSEEAKFWKIVSTKKNVDIKRFKLSLGHDFY